MTIAAIGDEKRHQGPHAIYVGPISNRATVALTADKAGDPYKADGYVLSGTPAGISLASPGKPEQRCKA